jgi:hypothetical protein
LTAGVGAIDRDEVERRADGAGNDYDRYIAIWAAWVGALATDDHVALRRWMDAQLDNVVSSGLRENWLTMFCGALTLIGEGADHRPQLRNAMRHAEAEGRSAEADCILALGYAAHVDGDDASAAELLAAASGDLFHDTANYIHHTVIQDLVVRPRMSPADFAGASDRGRGVDLADIIATSMV